MGIDESLMPELGSPPPQKALSIIWPPWEYPTRTILALGHLWLKLFTAEATADVPCLAESPYWAPPQELCPPHAGYEMASEVAPELELLMRSTRAPAEP
jgi:hypothetical protein